MRPTNTAPGSFIFAPTLSAFRYAEELWRTLPSPNPAQAEVLAKAFEAALSGLSLGATELEGLNLRRPHSSALSGAPAPPTQTNELKSVHHAN
jgi:hypothetical protein